ncbi:MAG: leucine-responsive regulatory protein [Nocardioides sp.]|jgi:Lrp/AsnC family leucine-responsive transcriptional regulator|nr:leucine-responsive regulatory protein [Nocardioides sp.]
MDDIDRRILEELADNARAPASEIARSIGLSRAAVHQRLARLERDGVITGYTVLLQAPGGRGSVTAMVMLNLDAPRYAEVASALQGWPEVRACWSIAGERDMVLIIDVATNDELMDVTARLNEMPAVRDTATHVALRTHFDRASRPAPSSDGRGGAARPR